AGDLSRRRELPARRRTRLVGDAARLRRAMVGVHHAVAFAVLAATFGAAAVGAWTYYRHREARGILTHLLALAQTLLVAQVGLGLLLLSSDHRAADKLHYLYGTLSLL